ncbi:MULTISPECIES: glycine-rich domain-containing protein [Pseudofrankia]|uniref:glycine-rich domain-containing protein n=1 Tax=Pseudofrankia TaxID=2994363 RepID=UPI000234B3BB|nr:MULTISPECIES: hypothetical protein [Pseudofrankia]OHV29863.1 hypothetical protein BCD49_35490 [Pseudofrankia sp. EUN1h]
MTTLAPSSTDTPPAVRRGRELVDETLFGRLTAKVAEDHPELTSDAERIVDQALAFLGACAGSPSRFSPSHAVDVGWHAFLLHTREYAQFCARVAGRFLHHVPEHPSEWGVTVLTVADMVAAIERAGFHVERDLWTGRHGECQTTNCHQCHATCHDSP